MAKILVVILTIFAVTLTSVFAAIRIQRSPSPQFGSFSGASAQSGSIGQPYPGHLNKPGFSQPGFGSQAYQPGFGNQGQRPGFGNQGNFGNNRPGFGGPGFSGPNRPGFNSVGPGGRPGQAANLRDGRNNGGLSISVARSVTIGGGGGSSSSAQAGSAGGK